MLLLKAIALWATIISASPIAEPVTVNPTAVFCSAVTALVTKAKAQPQATAYCSSYLSIKAATVTTNAKSTMQVYPREYRSSNYTATVYTTIPSATITSKVTVTSTSVSYITALPTVTCGIAAVKRGVSVVPKPACLATYTAAPIITSACKCLSIPIPTSTVTNVATVSAIKTVTVNTITQTDIVTATATQTATTTKADFNIRAVGGATASGLAQVDVYYPYDQGRRLIPFDNRGEPGNFRLDDSCRLLYTSLYQEGQFGYAVDGGPFQFGDTAFFDRQPVTCSVTPNKRLACTGTFGETINSICPDPTRTRNDFIWHLSNQVDCGEAFETFIE